MSNPMHADEFDSFGDWLRWRRKSFDWTQAMLAQRAGCTAAMIRKIEAGERKPSHQLAALLAAALGVPDEARLGFLAAARQGQTIASLSAPSFYKPPHNLPTPMTSLVNRVRDAGKLARLLIRADVRLLTVLGPPGIGKTRLGIHLAEMIAGYFPDGIWFVDLAPITDATLVLSTIAYVLGVAETGVMPLLERLRVTLAQKELLLLLDNFEQVSAAALEVAELLRGCKGLKVLATSRTPLLLAGEHEYALPPLSLPPHDLILEKLSADELPEILIEYEAVQLFVARVRQHQHDFSITPATAAQISTICLRLDGIPLAIELAAATLRRMTLNQLATMLQKEANWLQQLHSTARDLPTRQQTLTNAVVWSYRLLDTDTQTVFRQVGIFVGGFTADAAQAVCGADQVTLAHLTNHSLLARTPERWRMLEMIREFALAQMSNQERTATQQRYTSYFVRQAVPNLDILARDHANFRAALVWAIAAHDAESALTLCSKLCWFWETHGYLHAGLTLARATLAMPHAVDPDLRIDALERIATLSWQGHQFDVALRLAEEAVDLARRNALSGKLALALNLLGRIWIEQGDYEHAEVALQESTQLARQAAHLFNPGCPLTLLSEVALVRRDWAAAQTYLRQAMPYLAGEQESVYVSVFVAMAHTNLAEIALAYGNPFEARHELRQALPYAHLYIRRFRCVLVTLAGLLLAAVHTTLAEDAQAAATFLGAEAGLGEQTDAPSLLFYQPLIAQRSECAQRLLTQSQWQNALQVGRTWTLAQVAAEAEKWLTYHDTLWPRDQLTSPAGTPAP